MSQRTMAECATGQLNRLPWCYQRESARRRRDRAQEEVAMPFGGEGVQPAIGLALSGETRKNRGIKNGGLVVSLGFP